MNRQNFQPINRVDYEPPEFLVDYLYLSFVLGEQETMVTARSAVRRNQRAVRRSQTLRLDGEQLTLKELLIDGEKIENSRFFFSDQGLCIDAVPDSFNLEITTSICPEGNTALSGLYLSSGIFCTQCEAQGFRRITFFPDRPDVLTRIRTKITALRATCPVLLSNGNLVASGDMARGYHFVEWEDPFPKPSYLFALVAGNLECFEDRFVTASDKTVTLQIYVQRKNRERCEHAMASLQKAMCWDEAVYGLEYDLDRYMIVAVDDFNMGAMENKGLNIFNAKYVLASPESATDVDYLAIEGVIAHEYFHNWTGNRVTCRDWFQLSLKEGLTVFRDQQFSADQHSAAVQRVEAVRLLRQHQFREDGGPTAHPVRPDQYLEINNFYTVTVYNKGAEVIRMLHTLLGVQDFRRGMDLYIQRHDGQAVTCDDFVAAMSDASGKDLEQFKRWYSQAGTPVLRVTESWQPDTGIYRLGIAQTTPATPGQPVKEPLHVPIVIGLLAADGRDLTGTVRCPYERREAGIVLELREATQQFVFEGAAGKPVLSFLRSFSAPVKVVPFQSREELAFLMKHDGDLFNRWDAAFSLAEAVILERAETTGDQSSTPSIDPLFLEAMRHMLRSREDRSLSALALQLPAENHLLQSMRIIDPDRLHQAHRFIKRRLATQLGDDLLEQYWANEPAGPYQVSAADIGRRSLRLTCLDYLVAIADDRHDLFQICSDHYHRATNMTDQYGALAALGQHSGALRDELFAHFEQRWRDDPLVMDKWFALQAGSAAEDTFDRVSALLNHPSFSLKNPNRVRSLLGAFGQNHYHFHHLSGRGYRLLTAIIIELDPLNPQVAARLVSPFITWKRYDPARRQLIKTALEAIGGRDGVSRDVFEMVRKSLDTLD